MRDFSATGLRQAVFLDRDGVLNKLVERDGISASPRRLADFRVSEGAAEAVSRLRAVGLLVFVVTNQPDVARGKLADSELARMHEALTTAVGVDEIMVCPHDDADACGCRKPLPGMILALARRWDVDLTGSFVVGDSWKDVAAGRRAGCRTILIDRGGQGTDADVLVASLGEAVERIEQVLKAGWVRQ